MEHRSSRAGRLQFVLWRFVLWGGLAIALPVLGTLAGVLWQSHGSLARALWIGAPLLELRHPIAGAQIPV